jgi:hypothetical protein
MKQCPVCKSTYTDDTLSFCLTDGAALTAAPSTSSEVTQQMNFGSNQTREINPPIHVPFQSETPTQFSIPRNTTQTERKGSKPLAILAVVVLLAVIGIAVITAAYFAFSKTDNQATVTPTATPVQNNNANETQALKEELDRLKKQVDDQKNAKSNSALTTTPTTKPTPLQQGIVTARVNSPGDGFLSLRTEPSVKTGTQLVKIPTGSTIQIEDCQQNYITIDSRRGRWCMVSYNGKTGWVFDAWLVY